MSGLVLPVAVALYGWIAQYRLPVELLLLAVVLLDFALILGMVSIIAYVVDAFGQYSASAMTAVLITRCLMGTFLPLVTVPLTDVVGLGLGYTILAGICLAMAPIPVLVMRYGTVWRQRSVYTKDD